MWIKLAFIVSTVVVAIVLTFAPVFAQETRDSGDVTRTTTSVADDREDPDLGWLGLIGLVGLAGLMRKPHRVDHDRADRATHR
jgi:MYXO-CTERM domain-containing protein